MAEQVESIKWVPNTRFLVDGFRFQSPRCSSYFLTHMHGDHYCGAQTCLPQVVGFVHAVAVTTALAITAKRRSVATAVVACGPQTCAQLPSWYSQRGLSAPKQPRFACMS